METPHRHDVIEEGDQIALICVNDQHLQKTVVDQLAALNYQIHTGMFIEDVSLKLKTHSYTVVVIDENFDETGLEMNQVLHEATNMPLSQRRHQFIVLVGPSMVTNDDMQAFAHSVDLVCSTNDLSSLKLVVRRGVTRHREFYNTFNICNRAIENAALTA